MANMGLVRLPIASSGGRLSVRAFWPITIWMLTKQKLAEMNSRSSRPKGRGVALYAALGAVVAAVILGLLVSYALGAVVLLLGAAVFSLGRRGSGTPKVQLFYNLDAEAEARFSGIQKACEALAGSEKVWRIDGEEETADGGMPPAGPRSQVSVGPLETTEFSANVEIWGIESGGEKLFFLPECVLSYSDEQYRPISYGSFGVVYGQSRIAEDGEVPGDAEVGAEPERFPVTNGTRRAQELGRSPVVAYGSLTITGITEGQTLRLLVSNKARAVRFARPFGPGKEEAQGGDARTARETRARRNAEVTAEKNNALFKILGIEPGASQAEIHSAYKNKAKMYHPDRVASLAPEVREMAELRMKEINAAYGELKRRRGSGAR